MMTQQGRQEHLRRRNGNPDTVTIATLIGEVRQLRLDNQRLREGNGRLKDALVAAGVPLHLVIGIYLGLVQATEKTDG